MKINKIRFICFIKINIFVYENPTKLVGFFVYNLIIDFYDGSFFYLKNKFVVSPLYY